SVESTGLVSRRMRVAPESSALATTSVRIVSSRPPVYASRRSSRRWLEVNSSFAHVGILSPGTPLTRGVRGSTPKNVPYLEADQTTPASRDQLAAGGQKRPGDTD